MATFVDGYGLGLTDITAPYAVSYGHPGSDVGFIAWAGCLPFSGSVIVTLSQHRAGGHHLCLAPWCWPWRPLQARARAR